MKNYYQFLGLEYTASFNEVKKAYRDYAKRYHPDKHGNDTFFKERFQEIEAANHTLSDPIRRAEYDKKFFKKAEPVKQESVRKEPVKTYGQTEPSSSHTNTNHRQQNPNPNQQNTGNISTENVVPNNFISDNWGYPIFFVIGIIFLFFLIHASDKLGITNQMLDKLEFNSFTISSLIVSGVLGMIWYHFQD